MMTKEKYIADCQKASWCYKCARRNNCQEKDVVAMEERMAYSLKYVKVTVECLKYIYDSSVKTNPRESLLEKFLRQGVEGDKYGK